MLKLIEAIKSAEKIGCLTGAGISTLCGIPDFRGPKGLYRQKDAERIFDIEWFDRDPSIYYRGCAELVYGLDSYRPGPVHMALRHLEEIGKLRGIATQNIDMLHQKAGSSRVYEVHGSPLVHRCRKCGEKKSFAEILEMIKMTEVPRCACGGPFKPDITFFGEALPADALENAERLAMESDLFLILGTSLTVFPAASIPKFTLNAGGKIAIVNAQPTYLDDYAIATCTDLEAFANAVMQL